MQKKKAEKDSTNEQEDKKEPKSNGSGNRDMYGLIGAKWLFISNILQKLFTFVINQMIMIKSGPEIFGIAAVQLELLLSTLLFLSREGIRLALMRTIIGDSKTLKQQLVNISWIPSLLILITTIVLHVYCPTDFIGMSREVLLLYCFGALFESFGEAWLNIYNISFQLHYRARADTVAVLFKSLSTYLFVVHFNMGVNGFGYAQTIYGLSHFFTLVLPTIPPFSSFDLFLSFFPSVNVSLSSLSIDSLFGLDTSWTAIQLTGTSLLKHLLTQGDKIVLSFSANHFHQGIFAVTHNYGSLVARLLFQPLEESCRISFSQTSASILQLDTNKSSRDTLITSFNDYLCCLLKLMIVFGSIFPIFGSTYSRLLVKIVLGTRWYSEETVSTISVFCLYLFIMGINGISEAFIQAVASTSFFGIMNISLFCSSIVFYLTVQWLTSLYGTSGVIVANILAMVVRIIFNFQFISNYFAKKIDNFRLLGQICPSIVEGVVSMIVFGVVYLSSQRYSESDMSWKDSIIHLLIGMVCGVLFLGFLVYSEWKNLKRLISSRKSAEKKD